MVTIRVRNRSLHNHRSGDRDRSLTNVRKGTKKRRTDWPWTTNFTFRKTENDRNEAQWAQKRSFLFLRLLCFFVAKGRLFTAAELITTKNTKYTKWRRIVDWLSTYYTLYTTRY
jgi:hypothetical protein